MASSVKLNGPRHLSPEYLVDRLSGLQLNERKQDIFCDIPLLKCSETKNYASRSKIMVIMKGLPGSGKSTIVNALSSFYPWSVVCSADKFFQKHNTYKFDSNKLQEAHIFSKQSALSAAKSNVTCIIIDNTNLQFWEMKFYVDLADAFNYIVFVVQPLTPWCKNVKILAEKNSHGIDASILRKKLKAIEDLSPLYFGWFLNEADSNSILGVAANWLEMAFHVKHFEGWARRRLKIRSSQELIHHFCGGSYSLQELRLLHCTSKYTAKDDQATIDEYMNSAAVSKAIGTISPLCIVAFVITANTYGAQVVLNENQLKIWRNDEVRSRSSASSSSASSTGKKKKKFYPPQHKMGNVKIPPYRPNRSELRKRSRVTEVINDIDKVMRTSSKVKGVKAHLTLGTSVGVAPVQTGLDIMDLMELKRMVVPSGIYELPNARLVEYGPGSWVLYPRKKLIVETIFSYQL
ncbi:UNVERIFIED_CONTAM: hypothetical protein RMT77_013831 [Armadillidium vulgare]